MKGGRKSLRIVLFKKEKFRSLNLRRNREEEIKKKIRFGGIDKIWMIKWEMINKEDDVERKIVGREKGKRIEEIEKKEKWKGGIIEDEGKGWGIEERKNEKLEKNLKKGMKYIVDRMIENKERIEKYGDIENGRWKNGEKRVEKKGKGD